MKETSSPHLIYGNTGTVWFLHDFVANLVYLETMSSFSINENTTTPGTRLSEKAPVWGQADTPKKRKMDSKCHIFLGYSGVWLIVESNGKAWDHTIAILKEYSTCQHY